MLFRPLTRISSRVNTSSYGTAKAYYSSKMDRVHRVTMFKMPSAEDRQNMLQAYEGLKANNQKDGKPYILSMSVGPAEEDERSQGYTFVSKTEFASMEDMKYYDEECPAHKEVKSFIMNKTGLQGVLTVYFTPKVIGGTDL